VRDDAGVVVTCGWRQRARLAPAADAKPRSVPTSEPHAELAPYGHEGWVLEATEALARRLERGEKRDRRMARRLRRELDGAAALERVTLRGVRGAVVFALARGVTVGELCARGALAGEDRMDSTGLLRAAGLRELRGEVARTARPDVAARLVRAAGRDPHEV
jgi:hypothetical protein